MLMLAASTAAFAEGHALKVLLTNGSSETYYLSEKPRISFAGDDMMIASSTASTSYARKDVASITFEDASTSIDNVKKANSTSYRFDGNSFEADGMQISVYNMAGKQVTAGKDAVSLKSLQPGVYVVKAGKQSIKIKK